MLDQLQLEERLRNIKSNLKRYEQNIGRFIGEGYIGAVLRQNDTRLFGAERLRNIFSSTQTEHPLV